MATAVKLRPILDRQQWEMCNQPPFASAAGTHWISSKLFDQYQLIITSTTAQYLYDPRTDSYVLLPSGALGGAFGAGTCGTHHPNGPAGAALAGSTVTTLNTATNIVRSLAGYTVRITAGTGAGQDRVITSNTLGANAVLTVPAWTVTPDATSQYLIKSGRFYCFNGTTASSMKYYDLATNTWSAALSVVNVPATFLTDAKMQCTPGTLKTFAVGTSVGANTNATLSNTGKAWTVNQWANAQVRITVGTGAGQVRPIVSNTATVLTIAPVWTVIPDATSQYVIEGNDDYIYLIGNAAVTMYRYSISLNTWTVLAPGAARAVAPGAGCSLNWISGAPAPWNVENLILNGRRLYSFRGAAGGGLDYYDIAANTWVSTIPYWPSGQETFTTGSVFDNAGNATIICQKDITGRFFSYDVDAQQLNPLAVLFYPQGAAVVGDRMFTIDYIDGATTLTWVYFMISTGQVMFRMLLI